MNRRETLQMLGLSPAGGMSVESFVDPDPESRRTVLGNWSNKQAATALRRLADGIENHQVVVFGLSVSGDIAFDDIIKHRLNLSFAYKDNIGS